MSRLLDTGDLTEEWDGLRLKVALELDRVTDRGRLAASNPAYPEGGMVRRMADELGTSVDELLEWAAAQDDDELAALLDAR